MVLSNKKLKQRLRAQLAESLLKSDSLPNESFKSLLNSVAQKPNLSKREKRRVKAPSLLQDPQNQENGVDEKETLEGNAGLKKNNKRKREKDGVDDKDLSEKKNSKKKKKKKKKKVVKKEEEGLQKENGVKSEEIVVNETIETHNSNEDMDISTKVYVGGIPYYSTVDDIRSYFEGCGSITDIDCLKFPETGKFNGIAMISFRTDAAAKRALALDGSDMGGLLLKVQPYKPVREKKVSDFAPAMLEGYNRIYVGNLSWDTTEDELKKLFSDCRISSIRLGKDKETGEFRGFAHVDFADSLSVTMALKLDQKPLFGRPVRIRCAVPPKSVNPGSNSEPVVGKNETNVFNAHVGPTGGVTGVNDDVARKAKRQTCYECGEKGHLSSSCPNRKAADVAHTRNETDDVAFDTTDTYSSMVDTNIGDGKLKRRTCYECGEKGHLSSACPKKQGAADVAHTRNVTNDVAFGTTDTYASTVDADIGYGKVQRRTCYECGEKGHLSSMCPNKKATFFVADPVSKVNDFRFAPVAAVGDRVVDTNTVSSVSDGKLRRRTCYECGERGHLSSLCPKKQDTDVANVGKEGNDDVEVEKYEEPPKSSMAGVGNNNVSDGKIRRRTCYECGEKGHLSSLCPKKKAAETMGSVSKEVEKVEVVKSVTDVGKEDGNNVASSVSIGKIKRRSCYECGEKGHLSSMCPNKKADFLNPGSA
ncbi:hypothetical protein OSB04_025268 [Centaurea solstitialis]|uniref:Uncharacterized protein n=1 Tax=Centaurea solstitialis TaxID=347529 RepID=A0AA38SZE6_9ASTR|nr:hypothetical protein OSB04_025268 [Centaurea solstitialis]